MARRSLLVVALLALVAWTLALAPRADAWTRPPERIAGNNRYDTAAMVSSAAFEDGAATVVIASGESFPDGLAAGPLAALLDAPVLLTASDVPLAASMLEELERLEPERLVVVGGTAAVTDEVLDELEAATEITPERVAGPTRYDTATAVASLFPSPAPVAFVASGVDFPDALAGGAAASMGGAPLLLTPPDSLPDAVGNELARLAPPEALVLGGSAAVSDAVAAAVDARIAGGVRRLAGTDRYGTAAAIAADRAGTATEVLMATGETFPDALAAAPLARHLGAPILLTTTCEPPATIQFLRDRDWADVTVVGGPSAVPEFGLSLPCTPIPDGEVAPGVELETQVLEGPNIVRVLTIDRSGGTVVRPVTATGHLVGRVTTTEIARGNGVPVAVNGSFFNIDNGEPSFALAMEGRLAKAPGAGGTILALDRENPDEHLFTSPQFDITVGDLAVDRVNSGAPGGGEVGLFTSDDDRVVDVGTDYCRADLDPSGNPTVDEATGETVREYVIEDVGCDDTSITTKTHDVLAALADTTEGDLIAQIPVGDVVELRWTVHPDADGVTDIIGGNISLVHGGQISSDVTNNNGTFFSERAPRTAIGVLDDGNLVIVINDGRQPGRSNGFTPRELADYLIELGCTFALNLDGGGSTALVVDGMLANIPSAGAQRAVGTALLIDP